MTELSWKEFVEKYKPEEQTTKKGLLKYKVDIEDNSQIPQIDGRTLAIGKINNYRAMKKYTMHVWTIQSDNTLIPGRRIPYAKGYIFCSEPCDIEGDEFVNLNNI